jgi:hypothetical protein
MVVMCVALALTAACSSGGGKAQPAPLVEKSSAIAAGDAICKQLNADARQLFDTFHSSHPNPTEAEALDFWVNTFLPRYDRGIGDIHRIGEPTKDRTAWDTAVKAMDEGLSQMKAEISSDPVKVLSGTAAFDHANALFTAYGFKECGKKA